MNNMPMLQKLPISEWIGKNGRRITLSVVIDHSSNSVTFEVKTFDSGLPMHFGSLWQAKDVYKAECKRLSALEKKEEM